MKSALYHTIHENRSQNSLHLTNFSHHLWSAKIFTFIMFPIIEETEEFIDDAKKYQWAILNDKYRVKYCANDHSVQLKSFLDAIEVPRNDVDAFHTCLSLILPYIKDPEDGKLMEIREDGLYVHASFLIYVGIYNSPKFCAERVEECNQFFTQHFQNGE